MANFKVFVDGAAGTTGLRIHERLANAEDIELLLLPEEQRKDEAARLAAIETADVSILCLPDDAAKAIAAKAPASAKICDTSTAHRTTEGWQYGFPELQKRRSAIAEASRIAVPGCYPTGFLALASPLLEAGVVAKDHPFSLFALTGHSGGGKGMIAQYNDPARPGGFAAPRLYGLSLQHKHRPEMQAVAGLAKPPIFCPVVNDYYAGMLVTLPLPVEAVSPAYATPEKLAALLGDYYANEPLFTVHPAGEAPADGTIPANTMAGKDSIQLFVYGNQDQFLLCALYDNLGKGASGAAIQCMNLVLGRPETAGLNL